ncbi:hypothetical protein ABIA14_000513 [Sinorhizobium fredii]
MSTEPARRVIAKDILEAFSASLLEAGGFRADYARQSAELLVWANLRGADSHGVLRIPRYIEMAELGIVKGDAKPELSREFGAVAVIDGDRVPGATGMSMAVDKAVELAEKFGIGLCSIVRTSHAGAIGYFTERVARAGMVGIAMTASKPLMVYHGSRVEGVSTNPISIAAPSRNAARRDRARHVDGGGRVGQGHGGEGRRKVHPAGLGSGFEGHRNHRPNQGQGGLADGGPKRLRAFADDRDPGERPRRQPSHLGRPDRQAGCRIQRTDHCPQSNRLRTPRSS